MCSAAQGRNSALRRRRSSRTALSSQFGDMIRPPTPPRMHACARRLLATAASFAALAVRATLALDNGLGSTPPLAYSTWNYFNDAINDTLVRELADALVSTGPAHGRVRTLAQWSTPCVGG